MNTVSFRFGARPALAKRIAALVCVIGAHTIAFSSLRAAEFPLAPEQQIIGDVGDYETQAGDVLLDVARTYDLGYVQFMAANLGVDPWMPKPGTNITLPTVYIVPDVPRDGIVVNLAAHRLYYFPREGGRVLTFPVGVRRAGFETPVGVGKVTRKKENPTWYPTRSTRKDRPELPAAVGPGPNNPLGDYALYLSWPTILIHGTNKPYGVGRTVSRGCVRLYPEDIAVLFAEVPVGTPVRIIDEEVAVGWMGDDLYVQVYPDHVQSDEIETQGAMLSRHQPPTLIARVAAAAETRGAEVDWYAVERAGFDRSGLAVKVATSIAGGGSGPISLR